MDFSSFLEEDSFQWLGSPPIYKPWSSAILEGSHNPILRGEQQTMEQVLGWSSKFCPIPFMYGKLLGKYTSPMEYLRVIWAL